MKRTATIACTLLMLAPLARAVTLSTLSLPDAGYDIISWNTWKGQAFQLSAESPPSLVDTVSLKLEVFVPNVHWVLRIVGNTPVTNTPDPADLRGEFRPAPAMGSADPRGEFGPAPGMEAGTAVVLLTFERDRQQTFPPLEAGATYWLIAGMTAPDEEKSQPAGLVRWHYAATQAAPPGSAQDWAVGRYIASSGTEGTAWSSFADSPYLFGLTATPVPEPDTALLLAPAALFLRRRRV